MKAVCIRCCHRAQRRPVALGHRNRVAAEVLNGLQEGDIVILHPTDELREGACVKPQSDGR